MRKKGEGDILLDEQKHSGEHLAVNYQDWKLIYYILKTETKSILSACGERIAREFCCDVLPIKG